MHEIVEMQVHCEPEAYCKHNPVYTKGYECVIFDETEEKPHSCKSGEK